MLPSLALLEQIQSRILKISNHQGEYLRKVHYCLFLLGQKAGLRVSEAINFDLNAKTHKGLYRLNKTKGNKKRYVYIPQQVIQELKKHDWKPNNTNRWNFYHFLRKIKRELNLPTGIELTPHTLRRAFATYQAENGLPLPLLSKLLGHQSVRTTALYWMNIYNEDGNDTDDILTGKIWLEGPKKPSPEPAAPVKMSLELPELLITRPLVSKQLPDYLSQIHQLKSQLSQIQRENNDLKAKLDREREQSASLQNDLAELSEQNTILNQQKSHEITQREQIQQELSEARQIISQLEQKLNASESNLAHEKQINHDLQQQLHNEQETNANLKQKLHADEQSYSDLTSTYQIILKDKEKSEKQLTNLLTAIKTTAKQFQQWQKLNYYKQLERQQNELKAQIIQPPPWKT